MIGPNLDALAKNDTFNAMIDPLTSLAFAVHSNPGVYALLLGSGISSAAQIPTGHNVVLDLLRKIARVERQDCEPDPEAWWRSRTGKDPDYSVLLDVLAKTPAERQQLLKHYFEPTQEEEAEGLKLPTSAHKAIAWLVAEGFVRVIITTNFDRLIERALASEGVNASVVSTPDQIRGAMPLAHSGATIIKVNGDYLDSRIRNTPSELADYGKPMTKLLGQIFDEYGLIACGWSGDWDIGLAAAMLRTTSRRFTTFFAARGKPSDRADKLIKARRAEVIPIADADHFFVSLQRKVQALKDLNLPHPLSPKMAAALVKRYLAKPEDRIRLYDVIWEEVERVHTGRHGEDFPLDASLTSEELFRQVGRYESLTNELLAMIVTGCYWGGDDHQYLWVRALERIGAQPIAGSAEWARKLRGYPALLLLYGGGLAALAAKKYSTIAALLTQPVHLKDGTRLPLILNIQPFMVMAGGTAQLMPGMKNRYSPVSDHLFEQLREPLNHYLTDNAAYEAAFDEFEYLMALVTTDLSLQFLGAQRSFWGRFAWKGRNFGQPVLGKLEKEIEDGGENWPPLRAGLFGGEGTRAIRAKAELRGWIDKFTWL